MQAIIAEKASQAEALAAPFRHAKKGTHIEIAPCETFPDGALLAWCSGHLFEIVPPHEMDPKLKRWHLETLPMIPETFKYKIIPAKTSRFKAVKEIIRNPAVTEIISAGDPAREGELIVQLVVRMSGVNKPMRRLWVSSLTPRAVEQAFANLRPIEETMPLYHEAMARSYADWLIGMNASRAYTLLIQSKTKGAGRDVYAVGRVQTPTLALVVKREKEILAFVSKPFYEVVASFNMDGALYEGKWIKEKETRFYERENAEAIRDECMGKEAEAVEVKTENKPVPPPAFHSLSTLQALANKRFNFSPKKTLEVTQALYERSYVTYPRTDSNHVNPEEAAAFPAILRKLSQLEPYEQWAAGTTRSILSDKRYVDSKKVSDHYAIIPTEKVPALHSLSGDERKIYDLIARSLIAAHYNPALFAHSTIRTAVGPHIFVTNGKRLIEPGWRPVLFEKEKEDVLLPNVKEGQKGIAEDVKVVEGKTVPPKRYTEGELITAMKNVGYTVEDKELGNVLKSVSGLGEESTRSNIIERLKQLDYMKIEEHRVVPMAKAFVLIDAVENTLLASPELTGRWEQRLKEIGKGQAPANVFIEQSKRLAQKIVQDAIEHSAGWSFDAPSKPAARDHQPLGACPRCGSAVIDKGKFYGCSAYQSSKCGFILGKKMLGKSISAANVKKLLDKGKTNLIKGFKGKQPFDAYLVWKDKNEGTVQFEFKASKKQ
ncbi:DNA topoisomerase 3 [Domibacillus sp. PGB-M46]|uniref:type IA DNA topoisomerase n=1 Tax=Domibacillus sp. PGB-M46 TaxID=2910255 RepID=UPI001F5A11AE|nr:type IA DNA topoisomerase [Domibacillus sp. PGB-M46]MCI2255695.1 DNA topoisomerase 3 [Domibacillus sp. PGB-M46]